MAVPLDEMRLAKVRRLVCSALVALSATSARAQEVPPEPPPPTMTGPAQVPDAPAPSAPPTRSAEGAAAQTLAGQPSSASKSQPRGRTDEALPALLRHLGAVGAAWGPAPSPDGSRIGFVTTLFGSRQAALIPTSGGYPQQLTDEPGGVLAVRWAPQDPHLIFVQVLRGGQRRILLMDDAGGAPREVDAAPGEHHFGGFTRDGKRLLFASVDDGKVALKWLTLETRALTEVTPPLPQAGQQPTPAGEKKQLPPAPLADSLAGLFALSSPSQEAKYALAQVRVAGDETVLLIDLASTRVEVLTPHEGTARFRQARFSPDGRSVYLLTDAGRELLGVDVVNVQSKLRKTISAPAGEVEAFSLADDGHRLVTAQVSGGETLFNLLELPSLRQQPLPQPPPGALYSSGAGELSLSWSRSGDRLYFAWGQADDTVDLFALRSDFGNAQRLTRSPRPGLPAGALPRPKAQTFASFDGRAIPALLWGVQNSRTEASDNPALPKGAVVVNGGQARPVLDTRIAALSALGVLVLAPSPRGTEGRGKAHAVEDAAGALQDIAFAARQLRASGETDGGPPLLVGIGPGAAQAVGAAERDPAAWAGVVLVSDHPPEGARKLRVPVLTLSPHGASALSELAAFAREHLARGGASAAR